MPTRDSKIILSLQQRREIEQAIQALRGADDEEELSRRASEVARYGEAVIPVLLAQLGSADPQLRGGLALVARLLPREAIVPALRTVAADPGRSDGERMTAMTILERFLGEELGPEFFVGLDDPQQLAVASLREMLDEQARDPYALLEYLSQLEEEPTEVALTITEATARLDPAETVELLRMLSLDPRPPVARLALRRLGELRLPEAAIALQSLLPNLPAGHRPQAERSLRKLQLRGVVEPPPKRTWRVLISPVDGQGRQALWFISPDPQDEAHVLFIGLWLDDVPSLQRAVGREGMAASELIPAGDIGAVHLVRAFQEESITLLLEASFDAGRAILAEALDSHLSQEKPLPMAYRFYSRYLWAEPWEPAEQWTPPTPPEELATPEHTLKLLEHPAFLDWGVREPWVYDLAEELGRRFGAWWEEEITTHARTIAERAFSQERITLLSRRLHRMSRWLQMAGEPTLAGLAHWTAERLREEPSPFHPFLLGLAEMGLRLAALNLLRGVDPRRPSDEAQ